MGSEGKGDLMFLRKESQDGVVKNKQWYSLLKYNSRTAFYVFCEKNLPYPELEGETIEFLYLSKKA